MADPFDPANFGLQPAQPVAAPVAGQPASAQPQGDDFDPAKFGLTSAPVAPAVAAQPAVAGQKTGYGANVGAGIAEGAGDTLNVLADPVGNLIGKPVAAIASSVHDLLAPVFGYKAFTPEDRAFMLGDTAPQPGTRAVDVAADVAGATRPEDVQPGSLGQAQARNLVRGATDVATLGAGAGGGVLATGAKVAGDAVVGAAGAGGSSAAESVAPDALKPVAGLVGGAVTGATVAAPKAVFQAAVSNPLAALGQSIGLGTRNALTDASGTAVLDNAGKPLVVTAPQADAAAAKIASSASDPVAVKAALDQQGVSALPASPSTTYQLTGDRGLGDLEHGISQANNQPFLDVIAAQNKARVQALDSVPPATAAASDVGTAFRGQMDTLNSRTQVPVDQARTGLDTALTQLGGDAAGTDAASAQQQYGQTLRGQLDASNQAAKQQEGALWKAVDPDGTLAVNAEPLQAAANGILKDHGQFATPLSANESSILDLAAGAPDQMKFSDLKDLRSQVTDAISQARQAGDNQTVRRLSMLLDGVHETMEGGIVDQATKDQAAVQAGTISPDQSMMAKLQSVAQGQNVDTAVANVGAGNAGSQSVGGYAAGAAPSVAGVGGAESQANSGSSNASRGSGLQTPSAVTPFDADAQQRYADARAATADRHSTFTNAPGVGPVLQPGKWAGDFKMPDSNVPGQLFSAGQGAAEKVQAYLKAGGNPSDLAGYAAFDLRRNAQNADGTINPAKLATWQKSRGEALSAMPDLQQKLSTVAGAQDALDQASAAQKQVTTAYQQSAAGKFLGTDDPKAVVGSILADKKGSQAQMRQLASLTSNSPEARAGLQRAAIDHIFDQMQGDKAAGQTGTNQLYGATLQKFIRQKSGALGQIFDPNQMRVMQAIADDIKSSDQSIGGNILSGNSATAQNAAAMNKASVGGTLLEEVKRHGIETLLGAGTGSAIGSAVGGTLFGTTGAVAGGSIGATAGTLAGRVASGLKANNIATVDNLVKEAMLNPALARVLLSRVTPASAPNIGAALVTTLRRAATRGAVAANVQVQQPPRNALAR